MLLYTLTEESFPETKRKAFDRDFYSQNYI